MSSHRYPRQTYNMVRSLDESGRITWVTHLKQLLFQFGFGYAWLANEVGDTIAFTKLFKIRVVDCAIQTLNEKVNKLSKTLYYRIFKTLKYDAVLDWGLNPGPPALEASTIPLGYRGGDKCSNRTNMIFSYVINMFNTFTCN